MMSVAKLLVLLLVVAACIAFAKSLGARRSPKDSSSSSRVNQTSKNETLEKCPTCGVFRVEGMTQPCDRSDCPHR